MKMYRYHTRDIWFFYKENRKVVYTEYLNTVREYPIGPTIKIQQGITLPYKDNGNICATERGKDWQLRIMKRGERQAVISNYSRNCLPDWESSMSYLFDNSLPEDTWSTDMANEWMNFFDPRIFHGFFIVREPNYKYIGIRTSFPLINLSGLLDGELDIEWG